jgi:hypothetical protein
MLIKKYTIKTNGYNYEGNGFFEARLIKLDFTAKARSTQRTAFCLLAFNTCFSLRAQCL